MRTLSEKEALIFLLQLCEALENISELSLVHGDVSPQNILLTDVLPLKFPKAAAHIFHRKKYHRTMPECSCETDRL